MAVSVRNKIWYGTLFLFVLLILTGGAGIYFTAKLKMEARAVLQDNYESLSYGHTMQQQLDSLNVNYTASVSRFEEALKQQEGNITENGEQQATNELLRSFQKLKSGDTSAANVREMHEEIQRILHLNMSGIHNKDAKAEKTAKNAVAIIISLAGFLFLIAFTFSVNFPGIVTNPIKQLSEAIKEISSKNYKYRIHIDNKDEFGALADAFNSMAERLEYFESSNLNKLMFEKSRAEAVINSLKDASIGIDKENKILFANFQALQLLGLKSADIIGKSVDDLSKRNDLFSFLVQNESSAPFKIVVENRENYFIKEVIDVTQGEGSSKVIVLRNITSFKELDTAKNNFIATISHELKTPLASSDFSLKLIEDERIGTLSAEQKELIQNLKHDNERMLKILSELLNMSQVEAGRIQLDIQSIDPHKVIEDAIETVAASAKGKDVEIERIFEKDIPMVLADVEKTTWILNNFLTNAIKYSPGAGKIKVGLRQEAGNIIFSVTDDGQGIAPEYLARVFERYFQVPGSKAKGTGLGLAISKDFIEAQKGKIWVDSEIGKGATFSFSLSAIKA